jgi:hypothetical protein
MKLINVSSERFWNFVKFKNLKETQGEWFHSSYFVDENQNKLAYMETSSWGPSVIYKIMGEENEETLNLVNDIINLK